MTEELNGGCLDEREAFEAWADDQGFPLQPTVHGGEYQDLRTQTAWEGFKVGRASLSTSKQAGAEPVDWSKMGALGWQRINCPVCGDMARAAPGAAIAAREQCADAALREQETFAATMRAIYGNEFPTHPNNAGEYPGWHDHWQIFQAGAALASREEAPATPKAEPVTDAQITQWAERHDIRGSVGELRAMVGDARTLENADVATPPATSADADYLEFGATPFPVRKNPCKDCGGSGMDGDVGEQGQAITIDCSACHGSGEQTAKLPWPWENEAQLLHDAITYLEHQPRIADALGIMRAALTQPTTVQQAQSEPFNPLDHEQTK